MAPEDAQQAVQGAGRWPSRALVHLALQAMVVSPAQAAALLSTNSSAAAAAAWHVFARVGAQILAAAAATAVPGVRQLNTTTGPPIPARGTQLPGETKERQDMRAGFVWSSRWYRPAIY